MHQQDDDTTRTGLWVVFTTVAVLLIGLIIWVLKTAGVAVPQSGTTSPALLTTQDSQAPSNGQESEAATSMSHQQADGHLASAHAPEAGSTGSAAPVPATSGQLKDSASAAAASQQADSSAKAAAKAGQHQADAAAQAAIQPEDVHSSLHSATRQADLHHGATSSHQQPDTQGAAGTAGAAAALTSPASQALASAADTRQAAPMHDHPLHDNASSPSAPLASATDGSSAAARPGDESLAAVDARRGEEHSSSASQASGHGPAAADAQISEAIPDELIEFVPFDNIDAGELSAVVYFSSSSAQLPSDTDAEIAGVVDALQASDTQRVLVAGFHDATGNAAYNERLARKRAFAVRDALVAKGIAVERIIMRKPEQTTGSGTNAEARRVELRLID